MTEDIREIVIRSLEARLSSKGYLVADVISVPENEDRSVKIRTLAEALEEFDRDKESVGSSYLLQIKPKIRKKLEIPKECEDRHLVDEIYAETGELNVKFLNKNASLLLASGDFALAKNIYQAILQSGEDTANALFGLGVCLEKEQAFEKAVAHFEESIAYVPSLKVYLRLVSVLIKMKKDQYAAEVLERALMLPNLNASSQFDLHRACGNSWLRTGHLKKCELHYLRALELDSSSDEINSNLGSLYLKQERLEDAKKCFDESVALNPRNDRAWMGLASCALYDGDRKTAHEYYIRSLELNLKNPSALFYLIKTAFELKKYDRACEIVTKYVDCYPVSPNLLYSLAGLQYHLKRYSVALKTAKKILQIQPNHSGAVRLKKMILKIQG